jgi:hypothetical protein
VNITETISQADGGSIKASWVDRTQEWIDRLPVPYVAVYFGIWLLGSLVSHILIWTYGTAEFPRLFMPSVVVGVWVAVPLAFMHFADGLASGALESFRPALDCSDQALESLRGRLTTLPGGGLIVSSLGCVLLAVLGNLAFPQTIDFLLESERGRIPLVLLGSIAFGFVGAMIFYSVRQLLLIKRLYTQAERLTIFHPDQTYAFSTISAATALAWAALIYVTIVTFPQLLGNPIYTSTTAILALTIFASVASLLIGVNRRLVKEKNALRRAINMDLQAAFDRLHKLFASGKLDGVESLRHVISGMKDELELVNSLSTWPWQPGTIAGVLSALLLPAIVVLIQEVTLRLLG